MPNDNKTEEIHVMKILVCFCFFNHPLDLKYIIVTRFCVCKWPRSWFWHCTVHDRFVAICHLFLYIYIYISLHWNRLKETQLTSSLSCVVRSELIVWMQYTEPSMSTYCTLIFFLCSFISQGRVSSGVSFPWKAVLSSSCLPDLESPGGPLGCGDPL